LLIEEIDHSDHALERAAAGRILHETRHREIARVVAWRDEATAARAAALPSTSPALAIAPNTSHVRRAYADPPPAIMTSTITASASPRRPEARRSGALTKSGAASIN
jgi:hypothetical protein